MSNHRLWVWEKDRRVLPVFKDRGQTYCITQGGRLWMLDPEGWREVGNGMEVLRRKTDVFREFLKLLRALPHTQEKIFEGAPPSVVDRSDFRGRTLTAGGETYTIVGPDPIGPMVMWTVKDSRGIAGHTLHEMLEILFTSTEAEFELLTVGFFRCACGGNLFWAKVTTEDGKFELPLIDNVITDYTHGPVAPPEPRTKAPDQLAPPPAQPPASEEAMPPSKPPIPPLGADEKPIDLSKVVFVPRRSWAPSEDEELRNLVRKYPNDFYRVMREMIRKFNFRRNAGSYGARIYQSREVASPNDIMFEQINEVKKHEQILNGVVNPNTGEIELLPKDYDETRHDNTLQDTWFNDDVLPVSRVAEMLNVPRKTIDRWAEQGMLDRHLVGNGKAWGYPRESVLRRKAEHEKRMAQKNENNPPRSSLPPEIPAAPSMTTTQSTTVDLHKWLKGLVGALDAEIVTPDEFIAKVRSKVGA
jgi:hypothetical protein